MTSSYLHRAMNISFWLPIVIAIGVTLASPAAVRSAEDDAASAETENEQVDDGVEDDDGDDAETPESGQASNFFRVVGSILGFGDSAPSQEDDATLTLLGEPAAGFELQTPEGETFRLNDQRGKVVVLDFWATWCGPCVAAMPKLQQLHDQFAERDVLVVGVNQQESAEEVTKFTSKKGFTFAQVLDDDGSVGDRFSVTGIPRTVVIDPQGIIQAIHSGYSPTLGEKLASEVEQVLAGKTLFDAEKVAAAKARLKKAQAQLLGDLQPIAPERLERIGTIDLGTTVSLSANYAPSWVRGDGNDHLVLHIDSDSLAILEPGSDEASVVKLNWSDELATWDYVPIPTDQGIQWAALSYHYDDNYDIDKSTLARFNAQGQPQWAIDVPILGEYSPNVSIVAGDVTGDGAIETLLLVEYYLEGMAGAGFADNPRVLTVCSAEGEIILRTILPGAGGAGMHLFPSDGRNEILINNEERLDRYRVEVTVSDR